MNLGKKEKVLVLGSSGHIGSAIAHQLESEYEVYGTYYSKEPENKEHMIYCDVASEDICKILEQIMPDYVISSLRGGYEEQLRFHELTAQYIIKEKSRRLIFISTANVFDHDLTKPHYESDPLDAQTDYGTYKAECENRLTQLLGEQCIIIRIPAVWGRNCPRVRQLQQAKELATATNLKVNETTDTRIAKYIEFILCDKKTGIFHIGTTDMVDYYEFQKTVCQELGIKGPEFQVETEEETGYQVMFSQRDDVPEYLCHKVQDVLEEIFESND